MPSKRHLLEEIVSKLRQVDVLATLRRSGPPFTLSPGDLIGSTMVTSGTMTNRIDQL